MVPQRHGGIGIVRGVAEHTQLCFAGRLEGASPGGGKIVLGGGDARHDGRSPAQQSGNQQNGGQPCIVACFHSGKTPLNEYGLFTVICRPETCKPGTSSGNGDFASRPGEKT